MADRKGFTLLEVVLVLVIIGAVAAFVLPNVFVCVEQSNAQSARNNLLAIAAAQSKYDEDHGQYCVGNPCADNITDIDKNLNLTITPSANGSFSYSCSASGSYYQCIFKDQSDTVTLAVSNSGNGPQTNVSCNLNAGVNNSNYCPF